MAKKKTTRVGARVVKELRDFAKKLKKGKPIEVTQFRLIDGELFRRKLTLNLNKGTNDANPKKAGGRHTRSRKQDRDGVESDGDGSL